MTRAHIKYQIAKDETDTSDYVPQQMQEQASIAKKERTLWINASQTVISTSAYFVLSIGLTFYQQWLYNSYGFNFPLGVVLCHLVVKFSLAALIRCIRGWYKGQQPAKLAWPSIIRSLMPPGIASGLDVGLSNWAISLIPMSLYTMTKSTTIIFILGFSLVFKLEKMSWSLVSIVVMISGGLFMGTYKSTEFGLLGFILSLLASFSSGIRWTMTQLVMQKSKLGLRNPIDMMYYMQPWMSLPLIPAVLWFEGGLLYDKFKSTDWSDIESVTITTAAVLGGAILAFHMEVMEFLVVTYTSSLTLSITGILKEICILALAFEWKGETMSGLNFIGLLLCLCGIILHAVQKIILSRSGMHENSELQLGALAGNSFRHVEKTETSMPLLTQKSTSLTNLLNAEFSSDDEEIPRNDENSSQILSNILQRREQ